MSSFTGNQEEVPPFDGAIHLKCLEPTPAQTLTINEFRVALQDFPLYHKHMDWADDAQLLRFLIARNFNLPASLELIKGAMKWRDHRKPSEIEQSHHWPDRMAKESETGKIYCPGFDKWGRSVLVFDNTVQNTNSIDDQMIFLAWNLEFAIKLMKPQVDKYLVFMHLGNFSFFNTPPLASTKETINMLCNCFPERLGHCIAYQPPSVFRVFFNTVKGFLDAKTASKMVFIIGDVSEGSKNDLKMRELVGDNWKELVGAEQPVVKKGCGPGYDHDAFWPTVMDRLAALKVGESDSGKSSSGSPDEGTSPSASEKTTASSTVPSSSGAVDATESNTTVSADSTVDEDAEQVRYSAVLRLCAPATLILVPLTAALETTTVAAVAAVGTE